MGRQTPTQTGVSGHTAEQSVGEVGTSPLQQRETTEGERDDHLEGSTETDRDGQSAGATQRWREISNLSEQQMERGKYNLEGAAER